MKAKKPLRRYETANQIREEIELSKRHAIKKLLAAEGIEAEALKLIKNGAASLAYDKRLEAKRLRRQANRIQEVRIPKLGQKLSEFLTDLLPMNGNHDRSIHRRLD